MLMRILFISLFSSSVLSILVFIFSLLASTPAIALDKIKVNKGQSEIDIRTGYTYDILNKALAIGVDKFGPYEIEVAGFSIPNHQTLKELTRGEFINVAMALSTDEWEQNSIPIRIPLRRGIFSYRLLAINKSNSEAFNNINNLEQLKQLTIGLRKSWRTRETFEVLGFTISDAYSYDSIFAMLDKNRFDYIPRGIHEIYDEIEIRKASFPNLAVEPRLALHIPAPFYMFVSKTTPKIAERLSWGLEELVKQGILKDTFEQYYGGYIKDADLENRTIIHLGNPVLPSKTPLERKELWHSFSIPEDQ